MGAGGADAIQLPVSVRFGGPNPLSGEGCEVRDLLILFACLYMFYNIYLSVLVFGHYSPNTIHRHYSSARGALSAMFGCLEPSLVPWLLDCFC